METSLRRGLAAYLRIDRSEVDNAKRSHVSEEVRKARFRDSAVSESRRSKIGSYAQSCLIVQVRKVQILS